jgi:hypothetical protein
MKRALHGRCVTLPTVGEKARTFVPAPLTRIERTSSSWNGFRLEHFAAWLAPFLAAREAP